MRPANLKISNQNTRRTGHYITDNFDNRVLSPGFDLGSPEDEELIKRFAAGGTLLQEYECTDTGLTAALADAVATNIVVIPISEITGNFEVPYNVKVQGISRTGTIIYGTIQMNDQSILENLTIDNNTTGESDPTVGVLGPEDGYSIVNPSDPSQAKLYSVTVDVGSTAGPAYCVQLTCGGMIAYDTELLALEGIEGYAAFVTYGSFTHYSGRAVGTVAGLPYYLDI